MSAASKFVGRFAQLDITSLGASIHAWQHSADEQWFEAEAQVAKAIGDTRRYSEQEILLSNIAEVFRRASWFRGAEPGASIGASDASAQYVGTLAMLALLVRDRLRPEQLELLYRPFAHSIPISELGPE